MDGQIVKNYSLLHDRIKKEFVLGGHKAVAISRLLNDVKIYSYLNKDKDLQLTDKGKPEKSNVISALKPWMTSQSFLDSEIRKNKDL